MAQLNDYIADNGDNAGIPNRPTDRYSPNALARVTPKYSRGDAFDAYSIWHVANIGTCEETIFSAIKGGDASWTGGTYMLFTEGTTNGYIWFTVDGVGSDPTPGGTNHGQINIGSSDSSFDIRSKLTRLFRSFVNTTILMENSDSLSVRNMIPGVRTDATDGTLTDSVITVTVSTQGVNPNATPWDGTYTDIDGAQNLVYNDE